MNQSLRDQLKEWKKQMRQQETEKRKKKRSQKPQEPKSEHLSESDIKSLMGMNRARYARGRGGAFRQKG
jgi:hypothetical protein